MQVENKSPCIIGFQVRFELLGVEKTKKNGNESQPFYRLNRGRQVIRSKDQDGTDDWSRAWIVGLEDFYFLP
ncbi:hypothetical protein P8452_75926 [Trifolium repens]|nr:hypothetical protein P8452_75926 [Trifolium repens]